MDELFEMLESKIRQSGCTRDISGEDVYNDICDQIEDKENGTYMVLSKFRDDIIMEYTITIMDDDFNLQRIVVRADGDVYTSDFD